MTTTKQQQQEKAQLRKHALPVGSTVLTGKSGRKYKILEVLGAGGFGITYKAVAEVKLENGMTASMFFAIKEHFMKGCYRDTDRTRVLCPPTLKGDVEQSREDFRTEAERLMKLNGQSPHIVKVNEWFDANGTRYYAMEYLDGQTLEQYVGGRPLPEAKALSLLLPVARAVELVHRERLLHLDIKPDNIVLKTDLVSGAVFPVLIDFGLAKHFDGKGRPTSHLVAKGATEGYAPMEQYGEIDHFAPEIDVYALGATLFYLLTGKNPPKAFEMETVASLPCKLPPDVSPHVRRAIAGAMQPIKSSRTQTVAEFVAALEQVAGAPDEDRETSDGKTVVFERKEKRTRFRKKQVATNIVVSILVLAGGILLSNAFKVGSQQGIVSLPAENTTDFPSEAVDSIDNASSVKKEIDVEDNTQQINSKDATHFSRTRETNVTSDDKKIKNNISDTELYAQARTFSDYKALAEKGHVLSQRKLGDCYYKGEGVSQDYEEAVYWYTKAAEQGDIFTQEKLGTCYYNGKGVVQDYEKAVYWYTKSDEDGFAVGQLELGDCYYKGEGVAQDYEKAVYWYTKAAEDGSAVGQEKLGDCYYKGEGVAQDYEKAVYWHTKAAEQGYTVAQEELGTCYYNGKGVVQDYEKAVYWYIKAAEQDYSVAQFNLAVCYAWGQGVPQSDEKAREWWKKAKANGYAPYTLSQIKNGNSSKPIM